MSTPKNDKVGRFPLNATVVDMNIGPANEKKLTEAGKALTKADLIALWENKVTPGAKKATLGDIEIIKRAYAPAMSAKNAAEAGDINCCCCPCCCATTVVRPLKDLA
jgi:hypothetical protein